ncbi:MAG: hypothetical protein L0216_01540 [Planctomycetales bacterium]|nr:hypothetical protein [Planctomycetales bacterium]
MRCFLPVRVVGPDPVTHHQKIEKVLAGGTLPVTHHQKIESVIADPTSPAQIKADLKDDYERLRDSYERFRAVVGNTFREVDQVLDEKLKLGVSRKMEPTPEQREDIRSAYKRGQSVERIAKRTGLTVEEVKRVVKK